MGKHKKKHSKHDDGSDDLFDAAALSVRKFRKVTDEIAKLSPGQKLVGGAMLLAGGLLYLRKLRDEGADLPSWPFHLPLPKLPTMPAAAAEGSAEEVRAPDKPPKSAKPGKRPGGAVKNPSDQPAAGL